MVRFSVALLSSFAGVGVLSTSADDVLPPRFNFDRYTRMLDQSPFAIATAAALPETTPDFAKDLYVANAARSPEGDLVTIRSSSDQNFKKYLNTREPVDGYGIAQIDWSEDVGKTKVMISKDGKFATLTFNQALLAQQQGPLNARVAATQGRQAAPLMPPSVPREASRARSRADPKAAQAPPPNPVLPPSVAAIAPPDIDAREGIDLQQLQLEHQRRQQENKERLAREKKSVLE